MCIPFSRNHIIKYGLNISERHPEIGKFKSVVCKLMLHLSKQQIVIFILY